MRNLATPITSVEINGSAWRQILVDEYMLVGLGHGNGYEILKMNWDEGLSKVGELFAPHNSLVYGIDGIRRPNGIQVVSCSFYDKKIVSSFVNLLS